jgi:hypothetical protein
LIDANDVSEKRERFYLSAHEIDENLLVEIFVLALLRSRLKGDGVHDQRNKFGNLLVNVLLVKLIHQHHNDGQFLKNLIGLTKNVHKYVVK